jgi:hypothetical protein
MAPDNRYETFRSIQYIAGNLGAPDKASEAIRRRRSSMRHFMLPQQFGAGLGSPSRFVLYSRDRFA